MRSYVSPLCVESVKAAPMGIMLLLAISRIHQQYCVCQSLATSTSVQQMSPQAAPHKTKPHPVTNA